MFAALEGGFIKIIQVVVLLTIFFSVNLSAYTCRYSAKVFPNEGGVFYAKTIPTGSIGDTSGKTYIYKIGLDKDEIIDSYEWYGTQMVLAWSPIAGEVAVLRYTPDDEKVSLSFYIGGKHLKSYSRSELTLLGGERDGRKKSCGIRLNLEILDYEQFPVGTNGYVFKINFKSFGVRRFDVTTGLEVF